MGIDMKWIGDSLGRRPSARELAAIAKRARKREKREEDARRAAEGRAGHSFPAAWDRPLGYWDLFERAAANWTRGMLERRPAPRWRQRLRRRRALPWVGPS